MGVNPTESRQRNYHKGLLRDCEIVSSSTTQGPLHLAHGHTGAVAAGEVRDAREVVDAVRQRELLLHVGQLADPRIDRPLGPPSRPVVVRILVICKEFSSFSLQLDRRNVTDKSLLY